LATSPLLITRAVLFHLFFYVWTTLLTIFALPAALMLPPAGVRAIARLWMRVIHGALRLLVGLDYEVRGQAHLGTTPILIASKHQSAWETMVFHLLVPDIAVGLKEELMRIPGFGVYLRRSGSIRIDRRRAAKALRSLVDGAKAAVAQGCSVLIFPEGTRRPPGAPPDYKPGVVALYTALGVPVVPVALNSGLFWAPRSFLIQPGRIIIEFLPPIPPGLDRRTFLHELQQRIETGTDRLQAEARHQLDPDRLDSPDQPPYIEPAVPR
jgi:1-acyl-sn-glycerol-3-phosphate acyltransferase